VITLDGDRARVSAQTSVVRARPMKICARRIRGLLLVTRTTNRGANRIRTTRLQRHIRDVPTVMPKRPVSHNQRRRRPRLVELHRQWGSGRSQAGVVGAGAVEDRSNRLGRLVLVTVTDHRAAYRVSTARV